MIFKVNFSFSQWFGFSDCRNTATKAIVRWDRHSFLCKNSSHVCLQIFPHSTCFWDPNFPLYPSKVAVLGDWGRTSEYPAKPDQRPQCRAWISGIYLLRTNEPHVGKPVLVSAYDLRLLAVTDNLQTRPCWRVCKPALSSTPHPLPVRRRSRRDSGAPSGRQPHLKYAPAPEAHELTCRTASDSGTGHMLPAPLRLPPAGRIVKDCLNRASGLRAPWRRRVSARRDGTSGRRGRGDWAGRSEMAALAASGGRRQPGQWAAAGTRETSVADQCRVRRDSSVRAGPQSVRVTWVTRLTGHHVGQSGEWRASGPAPCLSDAGSAAASGRSTLQRTAWYVSPPGRRRCRLLRNGAAIRGLHSTGRQSHQTWPFLLYLYLCICHLYKVQRGVMIPASNTDGLHLWWLRLFPPHPIPPPPFHPIPSRPIPSGLSPWRGDLRAGGMVVGGPSWPAPGAIRHGIGAVARPRHTERCSDKHRQSILGARLSRLRIQTGRCHCCCRLPQCHYRYLLPTTRLRR